MLKKAQVILGFIFAFIAIIGLTIGLARVWIWFNANYAHREVAYQWSRTTAGQPSNYRNGGTRSYIDIGGEDTAVDSQNKYRPLQLTEEWVFQGKPSGQVAGGGLSWDILVPKCKKACIGAPGCGDTESSFNLNCPCYVKCRCKEITMPQLTNLRQMTASPSMGSLSEEMDKIADKCECLGLRSPMCADPWKWCQIGLGGRRDIWTLRKTAGEIEYKTNALAQVASDITTAAENTSSCCELETTQEQKECAENAQHQACLTLVNRRVSSWNEQIAKLNGKKQELETMIHDLDEAIDKSSERAAKICSDCECCTPDSYNALRTKFCREWGCERSPGIRAPCGEGWIMEPYDAGFGWGRECDFPTENCDESCRNPHIMGCVKCGLSQLAKNLQDRIDREIVPEINKLTQNMPKIQGCCSLAEKSEQLGCVAKAIWEVEEGTIDDFSVFF